MKWHQHLASIIIIGSLLSACGLNISLDNAQDSTEPTTVVATDPEVDVQATVEALVQATAQAEANEAIAEQATTPPFEPPPTTPTTMPDTTTVTTAPDDTTPETAPSPPQEGESAPPPDQPVVFAPDTEEAAQQTVNIQLVFDASGSMAEDIGGETKIAAARRAMEQVIDQLETDNPNLNVGFRVFGHEGDNTEAGKALSCQSTDLLVPLDGVDTTLLREQTNAWEPTGWTPISLALQRAGEDMQAGENVRNVIIMVTDGEETCEGDPCAVAQALAASDAEVRIDVVGFGLTPDVADTLQCISENTGGVYTDAQDGNALSETLIQLIVETIQRSYLRVIALGPDGQPAQNLLGINIFDEQGQPATILNEGMVPVTNPIAEGVAQLELEPGTYTFTIDNTYVVVGGESYELTYTAIVEEGKETVAIVGVGSIVFDNASNQDNPLCDARFERNVNGTWEQWRFGGSIIGCVQLFRFDTEYILPPGLYRVYDTEQNMAIIDNITVEPGEQVTVQITGQQVSR